MGSVAGKAEFDKLQAFNRDMLKKFMGEKEFNNFIKKETKSTIGEVLPFYITETPNDMGVVDQSKIAIVIQNYMKRISKDLGVDLYSAIKPNAKLLTITAPEQSDDSN